MPVYSRGTIKGLFSTFGDALASPSRDERRFRPLYRDDAHAIRSISPIERKGEGETEISRMKKYDIERPCVKVDADHERGE
jgi:hypothetical protein